MAVMLEDLVPMFSYGEISEPAVTHSEKVDMSVEHFVIERIQGGHALLFAQTKEKAFEAVSALGGHTFCKVQKWDLSSYVNVKLKDIQPCEQLTF